jgi:pSer/pThr/pTyr-binding forkhead associated (FHA) protein
MQDPAQKANTSPPGKPGRSFVLRFISGKYQGGEFPLVPEKQVIVGRSSELDMVLVEDMVSRKHARIIMQQDQIWIEDLGSTNGSFVNGEKIKRAKLKEGDRVLIGTSILKVIATEAGAVAEAPKRDLESFASERRATQTRTMSGSIEEVPLPDLLQLFGTSKKNGVLQIRTEQNLGKIYMRKGQIYYATIDDKTDLGPLKSVYRMLAWEKGFFDLEPPDTATFPNEIDASVQEVLMEGLRQLDELNVVKDKLPDPSAKLSLPKPFEKKFRDLSPNELDVLQTALTAGTVEGVMNAADASDLDASNVLMKLLKEHYLVAETEGF